MKRLFLLAAIAFSLVSMSYAQLDRSRIPAAGPAPEIKLGKYESFQMKNGLKVFVVENRKLPVVNFSLTIDNDPLLQKEKAGYSDFAGQLLRTGTKTRTKDQIDEQIDMIGATLNTFSEGFFASALTKHTDRLLEIISDIIMNPDFKQEEFDKIKKQTLSGLATQKDNPSAIAGNVRRVLVYGKDHPYGELVTEETVNKITMKDCQEYIAKYYAPDNGYLAIVGDIDLKTAKQLAEKYFGKWQKKQVAKAKYQVPSAPVLNKVAVVDRPNSVQSVVNFAYPVDLKNNSEDLIKASVANSILGGQFASRINLNLREKHGFTYGARSSLNADMLVGNMSISAEVRNSVTDSAFTEIIYEMKKMINEKVTDKELSTIKNYMSGSFAIALEQPQTIANFAINTERYNLPKDYYKNYLKKLSEINADDIQAMAKKYFKAENAYILAVGKASEITDKLKKFSAAGKVDYYTMYGDKYDPSLKNLPTDVTADKVIEKYISAIGGKNNILKVQDRKISMKGTVQGFQISMTITNKAPNKFLMEMNAGPMNQKTIFDGTKAVATSPMGNQEITGDNLEQLKSQAEMDYIFKLKEKNVKTELIGVEKVNGKEAYKVEYTLPGGDKYTECFDKETGLLIKQDRTISTPQGQFTQSVEYEDYKDVEGMKYPFKMKQFIAGQTIEVEVLSIEVNKNVPDSLFEIK